MKFVLHKRVVTDAAAPRKHYWFTIVAGNGEPVAASEIFTRKQSALDTIASLRSGIGPDTPIEDLARED